MTFTPISGRAHITGPLAMPGVVPGCQDQRDVSSDPLGVGLGEDGRAHGCHATYPGDVVGLQFDDLPPIDGYALRADVSLQQGTDALASATGAIEFAHLGRPTHQTEEKRQRFEEAAGQLNGALADIESTITVVEGRLRELPADDPNRAGLESKLTSLRERREQVVTAQTEITTQSGRFEVRVGQATERYQHRLSALEGLNRAIGGTQTGAQKAALVDATLAAYGRQGATAQSRALLTEIASYLRGHSTMANVEVRLQAVNAHSGQYRSGELQAVGALVDSARHHTEPRPATPPPAPTPPLAPARPRQGLGLPRFEYLTAASDTNALSRNEGITERYGALGRRFDAWMGQTTDSSWLYMANNASGQIGEALRVLGNTGGTFGFLMDHLVIDGTDAGHVREALATTNRQIYNTVVPVFETFLEAELNGEDGVQAVLQSEHYRTRLQNNPEHPEWAHTDSLIRGLRMYQQAQEATDPAVHDMLLREGNYQIADYEQRQVAQPMIGPLRAEFAELSGQMQWYDTIKARHDFMQGGNFADIDDRMAAIGRVSDHAVSLARLRVANPEEYSHARYEVQRSRGEIPGRGRNSI